MNEASQVCGKAAFEEGRGRAVEWAFLDGTDRSRALFEQALTSALSQIRTGWSRATAPTSGAAFEDLRATFAALEILPEKGLGLDFVSQEAGERIGAHAVSVWHPNYAGHLHPPPMLPSLVAEIFIAATNQSLDSFDQAPAATTIERLLIEWLGTLAGFGASADGVFTTGSTEANMMGLLLARERAATTLAGWSIAADGLPPEAARWRILCSEFAHFSVRKGAHVLGLGDRAVVPVAAPDGSLSGPALAAAIERLLQDGDRPIALALTAGTTDLGSIDRIGECATVARDHGLWVHVDAAVGGALLLSSHARLLDGVHLADSIAFDFHKLLFQAVGCGAFVARDGRALSALSRDIPYLDRIDDAFDPGPNLVGKSLLTSRRFEALKLWMSLRALGRQGVAEIVDATLSNARRAAEAIARSPALELLAEPVTNIVIFRWRSPTADPAEVDRINRMLPSSLWRKQTAVIGRTTYRAAPALKLTMLHPNASLEAIDGLVSAIETGGRELLDAHD
ncbi:L-2,4-diaminobutyrate decarboxylase [Roseiarcus fermentans]|uniref:L-2,4-diaminobutyrate decarboxylase n=1 Tax=Roseiarcus fermentans TaxID=1473586 RepID=A0A366EXH6_9HYPH|nr:aspartate aminotransferase family protein [Roseiarcus fermentans]RBP07103.1 L-2,4-diaminobutyrate decarboxylase [Roseiarcus fermentans]